MKLIIDMDGLVYKAAFGSQSTLRYMKLNGKKDDEAVFTSARDRNAWLKTKGYHKRKDWIDEFTETIVVEAEAPELAKEIFAGLVEDIVYKWQPDSAVAYLGGATNYRNDIFDGYKAGRTQAKPLNYYIVREAAEKLAIVREPFEADDLVIMDALSCTDNWVISSPDKDLRQIAGTFYNPDKDIVEKVDELTALSNFYSQIITGDPGDSIPGMGRGAAAAVGRIKECKREKDMMRICKEAYKGREETMHRNASLLYLLRSEGDSWQKYYEKQEEES